MDQQVDGRMSEQPRCDQCRWWDAPWKAGDKGACQLAECDNGTPDHPKSKAIAGESTGYGGAWLRTAPHFWCIQFAAHDQAPETGAAVTEAAAVQEVEGMMAQIQIAYFSAMLDIINQIVEAFKQGENYRALALMLAWRKAMVATINTAQGEAE